MKKIKKYFVVWWMMSRNSFLSYFQNRSGIIILLFGKIIRFLLFGGFLFFLLRTTGTLAGYTLEQTLIFYLTFNLIDVVSQFLFREVYRFRPLIIRGTFDLVLIKPVSPLFRSLMGGADILDLITIPPLIAAIWYLISLVGATPLQVGMFILLALNGLLIATAFHIAVISLGIITLEIDHSILIFRDLANLGRLPIDIYKEPLRSVITYVIPVGVMITLPAKSLLGLVTFPAVILSFILGFVAIYLSVLFWNFALKRYTSASS